MTTSPTPAPTATRPSVAAVRALLAQDRGSISLFFVVAALGLIAAVGLVVDGGGKIRALQRADAVAAEAARQGGQAVLAGPAIRGTDVQVQNTAALAAAQAYLTAAGVPGTVSIPDGTDLQITTSTTYTPVFLSLIGIGPVTTTGHADVHLVRGLDVPQ